MTYREIQEKELEQFSSLEDLEQINTKKDSKVFIIGDTVYKLLLRGAKKKEKILLKAMSLELKYLTRIRDFITRNGKVYGYTYDYDQNPLLREALLGEISIQQRLKYIEEILTTNNALRDSNLTFYDWHSQNVLAGEHVKLIDIDDIRNSTPSINSNADYYLFDLLVSIFINTDLTFNDDNSYLYNLLSSYFNESSILDHDTPNFDRIYNAMTSSSPNMINDLEQEVRRLA